MKRNNQGRLNQTVANASTKSTTMFFSQEVDEERLGNLRQRQAAFECREAKKLQEQVEDLTATLQINKQLLNEVFSSNPQASGNEQVRNLQQQVKLLNDENQYLAKRNKTLHKECEELNGRILLNEQITEQRLARAEEERKSLEEQTKELQEKLERKEFFMQTKEKKWM